MCHPPSGNSDLTPPLPLLSREHPRGFTGGMLGELRETKGKNVFFQDKSFCKARGQ